MSRWRYPAMLLAGCLLLTVFGLRFLVMSDVTNSRYYLTILLLIMAWLFPLIACLPSRVLNPLTLPLRAVRQHPLWHWLLLLMVAIAVILSWGILPENRYMHYIVATYVYVVIVSYTLNLQPDEIMVMRERLTNNPMTNVLLVLSTIVFLLGAVEFTMRQTMIYSDSFSLTLPHQAWMRRYWHPINSLNQRAYEPVANNPQQVDILVVGDSFAVGYGIEQIEDVFAYQLADLLGEGYQVNLTGAPGLSPSVRTLERFPHEPDIIILSHFLNDIDHAIENQPMNDIEIPPRIAWWVNRFYIPNYLFWNIYIARQVSNDYFGNVYAGYADATVWQRHTERLQGMVDWADDHNAHLIVVIFPNLVDLANSTIPNQQVADFFATQAIETLQVRYLIADMPIESRIVNRFDVHPSIAVHQTVAETLYSVVINRNN